MAEIDTSRIYYCKNRAGNNRYRISGQAYPQEARAHFPAAKLMELTVDAVAVYNGDSQGWGVTLPNPSDQTSDYLRVPGLPGSDDCAHLVQAVEGHLGRSGLTIISF